MGVVGIPTTLDDPSFMSARGDIHLDVDLDEVLATRTHVRVLRTLLALDQKMNLSARDVARRSDASHSRVIEVLRHLESLEVVTTDWAPTHGVRRLNDEHPLVRHIRSLFDAELEL